MAIGFDILGFSVDVLGDSVTVERTEQPGVVMTGATGVVTNIPRDPAKNTAGRALLAMQQVLNPGFGFSASIHKGIPLGSGLGGSAASAVAAVVAANALLEKPLGKIELLKFAMQGEAVSSGSLHVDNISPSLFGGLVLTVGIRTGSTLYFEAALVIGLLGFVSTVALAKFLMRGEVIE